MSRLTVITYCQQCQDSLTAYDILTTHQAKLCPVCLAVWRTQQQALVVSDNGPLNAARLAVR